MADNPNTHRLTFSIQGEDSECPECDRVVALDGIDVTLVTIEFRCPHCGCECYAESEDVEFPKQRH